MGLVYHLEPTFRSDGYFSFGKQSWCEKFSRVGRVVASVWPLSVCRSQYSVLRRFEPTDPLADSIVIRIDSPFAPPGEAPNHKTVDFSEAFFQKRKN